MKKLLFYIISIIFLFFTLCEYVFLYVLPDKVDLNKYIPLMVKEIKHKTNIDTQIGTISFDTFSDFSINFNISSLELNTINNQLLYSENLNLRIYLLPLIIRHINIKTISADKLKIILERDKKGKYNFNDISIKDKSEKYNFKVSNARLALNQYEIKYQDNFYSNNYVLTGDYFIINKFKENKFIDVSLFGNLLVNNKKSMPFKFIVKSKLPVEKHLDSKNENVDILIPSFDLKYIKNYVKEYLDKTLTDLSGDVSVKVNSESFRTSNDINLYVLLNNVKYLRNEKDMSVIANGKHFIKSQISASDRKLNIKEFSLLAKDIDVNVKGKILNFPDIKRAKSDLAVEVKNTKSEALYWLLPSEIPTDYNAIKKVKNYGFYSVANAKLNVKGKLEMPDIFGKLKLTDVYIIKPFASQVPKATIDLEFKGNHAWINSHTNSDTKEYVDVVGDIELYGEENVDLHITSTKNINLVYTRQVLVPLGDVFGFKLGPLPAMTFYDGFGNIDLYVKGNEKKAVLDGYFQCFDTETSLDFLDAKLTHAKAKLDFLHKKYHFETLKAIEGTDEIKIIGDGDVEGNLDFNIITKKFKATEGLRILQNSMIFEDFKQILSNIDEASGNVAFNVNIRGFIPTFDFEQIKNDIDYKTLVKFIDANTKIKKYGVDIQKLNGLANVERDKFNFDINGLLNNSNFKVKANSDMKNIKTEGEFSNLDVKNFMTEKFIGKFAKGLPKISTLADIKFEYNAPFDKVYSDKLFANIVFKKLIKNNISHITIQSGNITLKNKNLELKNVSFRYLMSQIQINGKVKDIFDKKPNINIDTNIQKLNLNDINKFIITFIANKHNSNSEFIKSLIKQSSGILTGNVHYSDNTLNGALSGKGIILKTPKLSQTIVIGDTNIKIKNNDMEITPFSVHFYQAPIFLKIKILSMLNNPQFDIYSTAKVSQIFVNEFLNNYLTYPIKLKGESILTATIRGNKDKSELYLSLKVPAQSDVSYFSVNLGNTFDDRELFLHALYEQNKINIKRFDYKKYIVTQNNKEKPLQILNVNGNILKDKKGYNLQALNIKTTIPASAKFFNVIFKKSIIKNGLFSCDLKLNGNIYNPKIIGNFSANNIEMPSYNAKIYDFDVDLSPTIAEIRTRVNAYNSDFELNSIIKNSTQQPIEINKLNINAKHIDLNSFEQELSKVTYEEYAKKTISNNTTLNNLSSLNIIIKKGQMIAKNISMRDLTAQNLNVDFSLDKNLLLNINKALFELAGGSVSGKITYNFKNTNLTANMKAKNISAAPVVKAFLLLDNQIYGTLNGSANIKTSGITEEQKTKNLNGKINFEISKGRMPKLGSLEYLLRAANLVKSGITGLTINSVLQLIIPLRTGDFSSLHGSFLLTKGIAHDIQIYSIGKSLNLYLKGKIDLLSANAKMEIWGNLDRNVKTPLGSLGNASLNSVFNIIPWLNLDEPQNRGIINSINKIPGIELSTQKNRIFRAVINGDISSDEFVEKFEWVKN